MHLVEQYALASGSKISKPYIRETYFPVPAQRYITFSPISKSSKNYDYWKEALSMLIPTLNKVGVSIVQIGAKGDRYFDGCINLLGKTSLTQTAYLIKRAILHLSTDTFTTHLASAFNKKIVSIYSNSPVQNCGPYSWSNRTESSVCLEPYLEGKCPSYALEEKPKTINTIEPEKIALSVLRSLGIETKVKHRTVSMGQKWNMDFLEVVPTSVAKFSQEAPRDRHVIRMDYAFNEEVMAAQLDSNPGLIVTNKPINIDILKEKAESIEQVIYLLRTTDYDANFIRLMDRVGVKNSVYSNLQGEDLKKLKFDFLDLNKPISLLEKKSIKNIRDYEKLDIKKLHFRSKKFVIEGDNIHPGKAAYEKNVKIESFSASPVPIIDCPSFWEEMDFFWITESV